MQMRTPVKLPGPRPHTTATISPLEAAASASVASTSFKRMVLLARCAGISRQATGSTLAPATRPTPTATTSFAVSNATIYAPRAADSFCMLKAHAPFMAAQNRVHTIHKAYWHSTIALAAGRLIPINTKNRPQATPTSDSFVISKTAALFRKAPPSFPILARSDSQNNSWGAL